MLTNFILITVSILLSAIFTRYWYSLGGNKVEAALVFVSSTLVLTGILGLFVR